ncbi:MAG: ATP-grasp domain-containing protein [bacterium]|nr:ATP-grasp domain-containing protein [bacterium]
MRNLKILVTAVGGDLSQSVVKCLRDSGYKPYIVGCDMNLYASGRAAGDEFLVAPPVKDTKTYIDFLLDTIKRKKINYVFPLSDVEILFLNSRRELFERSRAVLVMNEPQIIDTFMDKYRTVEFFKANGIAFPETYLPEEYEGQLGFPLILKRRQGSGSQKLFKVTDAEELEFYLKRNSGMILQEYLPQKDGEENEYTAALFSDGETLHTITFKRTLAPGGFSQQARLVSGGIAAQFPVQLGEVLDFKGSLNVQFRLTDRGCVPFEINPRFSSTVYFRHVFRFRDVVWSLKTAEGSPVSYSPLYKNGTAVKKFSEAFFEMEKL